MRVTGAADGEYTYALSLKPLGRVRADDAVQHVGDLCIVVAADSVEKLRGATIDWSEDPPRSGFKVINPNKPPPPRALPTLPDEHVPGRPAASAGPRPAPMPRWRQASTATSPAG